MVLVINQTHCRFYICINLRREKFWSNVRFWCINILMRALLILKDVVALMMRRHRVRLELENKHRTYGLKLH